MNPFTTIVFMIAAGVIGVFSAISLLVMMFGMWFTFGAAWGSLFNLAIFSLIGFVMYLIYRKYKAFFDEGLEQIR